MSNRLGFSLLECLVVMLMIAILLTIAAPPFRNLLLRNQVTTVVNRLSNAIIFARSLAVKRHEVIAVCGSHDGKNCSGRWSKGQIIINPMHGDVIRQYGALPKQFRLLWRGGFGKNDRIALNSQGFLDGQQGSFYICPGSQSNKFAVMIVISASGRLRLSYDETKLRRYCQ